MASLRARLIAGLLVVAAAGLLLLGGITYVEQRSFLYDRVDQQARDAIGFAGHVLAEQAAGRDRSAFPPPGGGGGGGPPPRLDVPSGTYVQWRDASGRVLQHRVLDVVQQTSATPDIPAHVRTGRLITVDAKGGSGPRYRVLAQPDRDSHGMTTVIAVPLREADQTLNRLALVEGLVIAGVLVALGVLAWLVVRLGLRPLDRIGRTAGAIAGGDLSHRVSPATERTEVGRLGLALNAMLSRLEDAFAERRASEDRLRRFIADASHELRTPLASIRGYSEVFRLGADRSPEETAKAMRRIEEEAARMGVLVEDLLTLARLDEMRDPVRERVDLATLARDAVDDARATAPDREIEVHADGAAAVVVGDPHALRQVLGNLLRNALVHTPAGTPVDVTVSREGHEAWLEVRDHGPGLPDGDPAALFERFWRARAGRERGRGGAGLGLAIVAGVVEAHNGRVQAANAAGGGARFLVRLPAAG